MDGANDLFADENEFSEYGEEGDVESEEFQEYQKTADETRREMAKKIIQEARMLKKRKKEKTGDIRGESDDDVTSLLQADLVKKRKEDYTKIFSSYEQIFKEREGNLESKILKGHLKPITCCKFSPIHKALVSCSKDSSIIYWDLSDLEKIKKIIISKGFPKDQNGHTDEILAMDISFDCKLLVTAGKDRVIRIWDMNKRVFRDALKGHLDTINSIKFKLNSYECCSVSDDRSFKIWDASQGGFMENFYGHKSSILEVDVLSKNYMVSGGYDKRPIVWKIPQESQLVFKERDYPLDTVRGINQTKFASGGQDGEICLWSLNKIKPVCKIKHMHRGGWIGSLGNVYQSDLLVSGGYDGKLNFYQIELEAKSIKKKFELECEGVINDIQVDHARRLVAVVVSSENRLGRWVTTKNRSYVKIFEF